MSSRSVSFRNALSLPFPISKQCVTHTAHRVLVAETDMMGIVHHAQYPLHFEEGRLDYMRSRGLPYKQLSSNGSHMAVIQMGLTYKYPARFDDLLDIETILCAHSRATVRFDYVIRLAENSPSESGKLLVSGHTLLACVNDAGRPKALPRTVEEHLLSPEV